LYGGHDFPAMQVFEDSFHLRVFFSIKIGSVERGEDVVAPLFPFGNAERVVFCLAGGLL
jgi:hypothetical protein